MIVVDLESALWVAGGLLYLIPAVGVAWLTYLFERDQSRSLGRASALEAAGNAVSGIVFGMIWPVFLLVVWASSKEELER